LRCCEPGLATAPSRAQPRRTQRMLGFLASGATNAAPVNQGWYGLVLDDEWLRMESWRSPDWEPGVLRTGSLKFSGTGRGFKVRFSGNSWSRTSLAWCLRSPSASGCRASSPEGAHHDLVNQLETSPPVLRSSPDQAGESTTFCDGPSSTARRTSVGCAPRQGGTRGCGRLERAGERRGRAARRRGRRSPHDARQPTTSSGSWLEPGPLPRLVTRMFRADATERRIEASHTLAIYVEHSAATEGDS
jgi:hypothetical protein